MAGQFAGARDECKRLRPGAVGHVGLDVIVLGFALRHLVMANEILACTLLTIHNVHFHLDLVAQARSHIEAGDYGT